MDTTEIVSDNERFGSDDPADWRLPERTVKFNPMGALPETDVPIVHRGTFNEVVDPGADRGENILSPANCGHVPIGALRSVAGGDVPDHLRDQLEPYERFEYKPFPVDPTAVSQATALTERLEVRPPRRFEQFRALFG